MFRNIYQMTPEETQSFRDADQARFVELLNAGLAFPLRLAVHLPHAGSDEAGCLVRAYGLSPGQEALLTPDWAKNRVLCILSILQSEELLAQMLPSKIVSQLIHLAKSSQFLPLARLLKGLQRKAAKDPKESERFAALAQKAELSHREACREEEEDDDFDDDEFKAMVYRPNSILPLDKLRLSPEIRLAVQWFCKKYRHRKALMAEGLPWGNRLLLAGPPGNGKTALAGALSERLGLPMFIVNMGELRRSHIGETGRQMSILFQGLRHSSMIQDGKAVLFFDECDSVATHRIYEQGADKEDSASLNVLLNSLDQMDSETIVVAATNAPEELDPAFKRRFSSYLWLAPPSPTEIQSYVADYQKEHKILFNQKERNKIRNLYGKPWAKVTEFCQGIHTARILGSSFPLNSVDWSGKKAEKGVMGFRGDR